MHTWYSVKVNEYVAYHQCYSITLEESITMEESITLEESITSNNNYF